MRLVLGMVLVGLAIVSLSLATARANDVEVKGPHICCKNCVKTVKNLLGKVDGVSEVKADTKTKTVTFKAKDQAAASAGVKALVDGGFFGAATSDGKELKIDVPAGNKGETKKITVKDVHACCRTCHAAISDLFKGSKVTIAGSGPRRTVIIEGAGLQPIAVLEALRKTGFNGAIDK